MMYEIEHGIEIPKSRRRGRPTLYPFEQMQVGDSFFSPGRKTVMSTKRMSRLRQAGWSFAVRKAVKDGVEGLRIWRVK